MPKHLHDKIALDKDSRSEKRKARLITWWMGCLKTNLRWNKKIKDKAFRLSKDSIEQKKVKIYRYFNTYGK